MKSFKTTTIAFLISCLMVIQANAQDVQIAFFNQNTSQWEFSIDTEDVLTYGNDFISEQGYSSTMEFDGLDFVVDDNDSNYYFRLYGTINDTIGFTDLVLLKRTGNSLWTDEGNTTAPTAGYVCSNMYCCLNCQKKVSGWLFKTVSCDCTAQNNTPGCLGYTGEVEVHCSKDWLWQTPIGSTVHSGVTERIIADN